MFTFPHANGLQISDEEFLAGWFVWFDRFGAGLNPATDVMPRRNVAQGLANQLSAGHRFSLDVLCRMLAAPPYRNGMQATRPLMDANSRLLEHAVAIGVHGAPINGARLTDYVRKLLAQRVGISLHADEVEARIEADVELNVEGMEQMLAEALAEPYKVQTTEAPRGVITTACRPGRAFGRLGRDGYLPAEISRPELRRAALRLGPPARPLLLAHARDGSAG